MSYGTTPHWHASWNCSANATEDTAMNRTATVLTLIAASLLGATAHAAEPQSEVAQAIAEQGNRALSEMRAHMHNGMLAEIRSQMRENLRHTALPALALHKPAVDRDVACTGNGASS
jgi:hypothetical protein